MTGTKLETTHPDWCTRTDQCMKHPDYPQHEGQPERWQTSTSLCLLTLQTQRWDEQPHGTVLDRTLILKLSIEETQPVDAGSLHAGCVRMDRDDAIELLERLSTFVAKFDEPQNEAAR